MKKTMAIVSVLAVFTVIYVFGKMGWWDGMTASVTNAPWWVTVTFLGILFSAYGYLNAKNSERKTEQAWIEDEGEKWMDKIKEAREKR